MNSLTNYSDDFLAALEAAADVELGDGDGTRYMKFKKGLWTVGASEDPAPATDYVALAPLSTKGWIRWDSGRPTVREMRPFHAPEAMRGELGDNDERSWPVGRDGKSSDPWQYTYELPLVTKDGGSKFTFSTSSFGGRKAVSSTVKAFVTRVRGSGPGELPVVRLAADSYRHERFGEVSVPVLSVVDWIADPGLEPPTALELPSVARQLDDEIPF